MLKPLFLQPNDKVAIVAPSGKIFPDEIQYSIEKLKQWNLNPVFGQNLYQEYYEGYQYAGTQKQRLSDFQKALDDPTIKAIWCARGGYGAVHLIDDLNFENFIQQPKWIVGYSDSTVFHNHLNNLGIATLHAVTLKKLNVDYHDLTFDTLRDTLFGKIPTYEWDTQPYNQLGTAEGILVGGNLSIIYSLCGTNSQINEENPILFIEDWNENWYHLDRMMMNVKRTGLLEKLKGLLVGSFTRMDVESENPEYYNPFDPVSLALIHKFMKEYEIPISYCFPAGHIGENRALIMGNKVKLTVSQDNSTLEFL